MRGAAREGVWGVTVGAAKPSAILSLMSLSLESVITTTITTTTTTTTTAAPVLVSRDLALLHPLTLQLLQPPLALTLLAPVVPAPKKISTEKQQ